MSERTRANVSERSERNALPLMAWTNVATIARKELRGYFQSAVALIFLTVFLAACLFVTFWFNKFFARNIADIRPLFDSLPGLLILLAAALSMRLWSEEHKLGTTELLMTLPVPHHQVVLGKFFGGLGLLALALVLTLPIPITVSLVGDLDWGPVIGGYLAALLLAATYLAVGLAISATTDNQIIALIGTGVVCAVLYYADFLAQGRRARLFVLIAEKLDIDRHFESIARGVLDLRDVAYYASMIAVALALCILALRRRTWSLTRRGPGRRRTTMLATALIAGNAIALNLWLAPLGRARIDLTEHDEFSLSPATRELVGALDQPLTIRAYFSERTHPLLAPLVPQIRDMLDEYAIAGDGKVRIEVVDPSQNEELEREALEQFDIKSVPFKFADRNETAVVNAYFHLLVQYGDQFEVLPFDSLIEVKSVDVGDIDVRLRNLEYDLTKTIKKVAYGFQSLEALFAELPGKAELTAYMTPATLPQNWKELPDKLRKVTDKLATESGGKLGFTVVEPKTDAERQALYKQYGFQPFATSIMSRDVFYAHLVLKIGDREVPFLPPDEPSEAALESAITDIVKRAAPGFIKRVGLWTPPAPAAEPSPDGRPQRPERPPQSFQLLRQALAENYEVEPVDLASGRVTDAIEVLVLAGPVELGDKERRAVDQFVMRGGALVLLGGRFRLDLAGGQLAVQPVATGLEALLSGWGVEVQPKLVLDEQNDSFPIPVSRDLGNGMVVREMQLLPYPFFARVTDGLSDDNPATAPLNGAIFHWASPVVVTRKDGEGAPAVEILARSSDRTWLQGTTVIQPDFRIFPGNGFGRPDKLEAAEQGARDLAVALTGSFPSLAARQAKDAAAKPDGAAPDGGKDAAAERLLEQSPPGTRVVVIGSSSFVSDEVIELSRSTGSEHILNDVQLVQNLVDWAVADTDLLTIRSRGNYTRTLDVPEAERGRWELINYGLVALGLAGVIGGAALRRRSRKPMPLDPPRAAGKEVA
jgi:ABC-2 type transport system permease protein